MNEFFAKYADLTALSLTLLIPLSLTIYLKRKARKRIRAVASYFLVFGPSGILVFMFFHLFENSYRAIEQTINGSFAYDFRFYSLILFGLVLAYAGSLFLKACFIKCLAQSNSNGAYFYKVILVLLITLPLIPITPIAMVPVICCSISVLAFPFVRRKLKSSKNHVTHTSPGSRVLSYP
jgi:hypothetical protein